MTPLLTLSLLLGASARDASALAPQDAQAILQIESQRLPPLALASFVGSEDAATRQRAARALGRLRVSAALAPLGRLVADPDPGVRAEAAWALGITPGGDRALLTRLQEETDPDVRIAALRALGGQGGADSVPVLVAAIQTPPRLLARPDDARSAALALGRMGLRGVEAAGRPAVLRALVDQQHRIDGPTRLAAAYALARIKPASLDGEGRTALLQWTTTEPDAAVQAYLVRAASGLPSGPDLHRALASTSQDPDDGVRIATARAAGLAGWAGVAAMLTDAVPAVRREAMAAAGQIDSIDLAALLLPFVEAGATLDAAEAARASGDDRLLDAAAALAALAEAGLVEQPRAYLKAERPTAIRVAALAASDTPLHLRTLAADDGEPRVRTAAAARLLDLDDLDSLHARLLLGAFDPMVAAMAAEWLAERPDRRAEGALLALLEEADEPAVLAGCLAALRALYAGERPVVRAPETPVEPFIAPLYNHVDAQVRHAALELADALDLDAPGPHHAVVVAPLEALDDITSARIRTTKGEVIVQLLPEEAPITVHNFVRLAEERWFDNLRVHRVVPDFVVQGGDPRGDGTGGPGYSIPDEPSPLTYTEGTVGMALSGPDTGGSQWFVTLSPQPHLDDTYPIFGRVTAGMHVLHALDTTDRIEAVRVERLRAPEALAAAGTTPDAGPAPDAGAPDDAKADDASDSDDTRNIEKP